MARWTARFGGIGSRREVAVAVVAGATAVAGSFALAGFTRSFVAAPLNRLLTDLMPGPVLAFAIVVLGDLGQQLGLAVALVATVGLFALATLAALQTEGRYTRVGVGGVFAAVLGFLLTGAPLQVLVTGAPVMAVLVLATDTWGSVDGGDARRRLLRVAAAALGFGAVGTFLGSQRGSGPQFADPDPAVDPYLAEAEEKSLDVDGLEGLVSGDFYEVDINSFNPEVRAEEWTLSVTGAVPEETTFDLAAIEGRETEYRFETLRCVGESLNGHKMDTAVWTTTPLGPLLEELEVPEECCVMLRAADGYYNEFPLAALREGSLAYGMNGRPLPRRHGYPVRALIPGHWGEINVKWLTEIEVLEREAEGYWEKRGWHGTGPVNTVAKLHAVNDLPDGRKQVGGHAYAGVRGIETVEVSTDGGETWTEATLSEPLDGVDVWRQWKHEYVPDGAHEVVVRAVDGTGTLQPEAETDAFPSGPTGWVRRDVG